MVLMVHKLNRFLHSVALRSDRICVCFLAHKGKKTTISYFFCGHIETLKTSLSLHKRLVEPHPGGKTRLVPLSFLAFLLHYKYIACLSMLFL